MRVELILDRIEEDKVAVLTDGECRVYECSASLLPKDAKESDAFYGLTDDAGNIISIETRVNERAGENKKRLLGLFEKNKNKNK